MKSSCFYFAVSPGRSTRQGSVKPTEISETESIAEGAVSTSPVRWTRRLRNTSESSNVSEMSNASPGRSRRMKIGEVEGELHQSPSRSSRRLKKISESGDGEKLSPQSSRLRRISESSNASDVSTSSVGRSTRTRRSKKVSSTIS